MQVNVPQEVFIHTTAASHRKIYDQFFAVNRWHKKRFGEYCKSSLGYYGGYTIIITGGKEYRYREDHEECCAATGYNTSALHVALGFDGDSEMPLPQDVELLKKRLKKWQKKYNIPNEKVYFRPHRAVAPYRS